MVTPKAKELEKKELPKITITKPPGADERLRMIKPVKVQKAAEEAMTRTERNAAKVADTFTTHFENALGNTAKGKQFLANIKKNSEIGGLLF